MADASQGMGQVAEANLGMGQVDDASLGNGCKQRKLLALDKVSLVVMVSHSHQCCSTVIENCLSFTHYYDFCHLSHATLDRLHSQGTLKFD